MRKILRYLIQHLNEDFNAFLYGSIGLFLTISIYLNFKFDFEDSVIDTSPAFQRFLLYFITHAIAYYVPAILYILFKNSSAIRSLKFWGRSLLAITLLSVDRSDPILIPLLNKVLDPQLQYFASKIANNVLGIFSLIIPLMIVYWIYDNQHGHRYGLNSKKFDSSPYWLIVLLMAPIIIIVSFLPSFIDQYPMYVHTNAHNFLGVPEWVTVAGYEFTYGLNFLSIEFFYRGFLVIGMAAFLGRGSVLCMASLYCFLHFGKPMAEAISSIFGGFILGVIAYETRTIWGGVIAHIGIAWMMEAAAFIQSWRSSPQ